MLQDAQIERAILKPTRVRYRVVAFAVTLAMLAYLDRVSISFAAPFIARDLHLSSVQVGYIFGAFAWAYALFEVPAGILGDRKGPRKILIRIVLCWSALTSATGLAGNFSSMLAIRFLFGAGEAGCFPNLTKAMSLWLDRAARAKAQGLLWLSARWGGAFAPLLTKMVLDRVGWRHTFELFGLLGLLWAATFWFWYRDSPAQDPRVNRAELDLISSSATEAVHTSVPWKLILRSRQVWLLCWQYFCLAYCWYFYVTWLPTYLTDARHLNLGRSALLSILPLFVGGLGNVASYYIQNAMFRLIHDVRLARRFTAFFGLAGASILLVSSTRITEPLPAMVVVGIASFCNDVVTPVGWVSMVDIAPKYAGTLSGALNMCGNLGGAISPIVTGYLLTWTQGNWNITFYIAGCVYIVGMVLWAFLDPVTPLKLENSAAEALKSIQA